MGSNVSDTWQQAKNLLSPAADSRTHFHNWGLKGQRKWAGIVLSWLVIRMVLLSISFIHSYNYKWGPLYASDLTHTDTFYHTHKNTHTHTHIDEHKHKHNDGMKPVIEWTVWRRWKVHNVVSYLCVALGFDAGERRWESLRTVISASLRWQPVIVARGRSGTRWTVAALFFFCCFLNVVSYEHSRSRSVFVRLHRAAVNPFLTAGREGTQKRKKNASGKVWERRESVPDEMFWDFFFFFFLITCDKAIHL